MLNLMRMIIPFMFLTLFCGSVYADSGYDYDGGDQAQSDICHDIHDPLMKLNRLMLYFNGALDYVILKPIARGYNSGLDAPTKKKVSNFLSNLSAPFTALNYVLQGDIRNAGLTFWQFTINSTLGIFGIFDVASSNGLKTKPQTFGSTLAHYGAGPGVYLVLPIKGITNTRDMFDVFFADDFNFIEDQMPSWAQYSITAGNLVAGRAATLGIGEQVTKMSSDIYVTIRTMAHQSREHELDYPKSYRCYNEK